MPQFFVNPKSGRAISFPPSAEGPRAFHAGMAGYQPTPLHALASFQRRFILQRVWVKDESHRFGLPSFKILGASWAIARALCELFKISLEENPSLEDLRGRIASLPPIRLTSATDGNHGRAVAHVASLLGLKASIFMPAASSPLRVHAIESGGATVHVGGTYDDAIAEAARAADEGGLLIQDTAFKGYEQIPKWIVEGYATLLCEVDESLRLLREETPTHVFVQMGVGSFAEAVVRHFRRKGLKFRPRIIGVEPDGAACVLESIRKGGVVTLDGEQHSIMAGLNCGTMSLSAYPVLEQGIDCFVAIDDDRAKEAMRLLVEEGIISGETGAAGLGGLLEVLTRSNLMKELDISSSSRILLISTEGGTDPVAYKAITGKDPTFKSRGFQRDRITGSRK